MLARREVELLPEGAAGCARGGAKSAAAWPRSAVAGSCRPSCCLLRHREVMANCCGGVRAGRC